MMAHSISRTAYKPVALLLGLGAGVLAGAVFKQVWKLAAGEGDAPTADDEDRAWGEILAAAALQGAIAYAVRAAVLRSGHMGVRKLTGSWPD
jgi:hypothetical protein